MRKTAAILLAVLCIVFLPVTASAETTTISVDVPAPSYQLNIPSDMAIQYKDAGCLLSVPAISDASGFKENMGMKVSISYSGAFTCAGVSSTIPFTLSMVVNDTAQPWASGDCLYFARTEDGGMSSNGYTEAGACPSSMRLSIADAAWEAAFPGHYTASIAFDVSYTTAE